MSKTRQEQSNNQETNNQETDQEMTDFGYTQVPKQEKEKHVADVFHSVADKYDVMNDLMSLGIHRIWKKITIEYSSVRRGQKILDLAGGTGDLTAKFAQLVGDDGLVVLADINASMLKVGRDKLRDKGLFKNIEYVQADAQALPFVDNFFDCITMSFGLRNVTDKAQALKSMWRVLKPGGRLVILEFSKPEYRLLTKAYDIYSFTVLPLMGKFIAGDFDSYRYLAESIRMHPDQLKLKTMMEDAGFKDAQYHNMTGGIVALHIGFKF